MARNFKLASGLLVAVVAIAANSGCNDEEDAVDAGAGKNAGAAAGSSGDGKGGGAGKGGSSSEAGTGNSATGGTDGQGDAGAPPLELGGTGGVGGGFELGGEAGSGGAGGSPTVEATPIITNISPTGHDRFYGSAFDAQGNLYAVGQITTSNDANSDIATLIAKFKPDGSLDTTFAAGGVYVRNVATGTNGELFRNIVVQSTGKIVVAGTVEHPGATDARERDAALMRVNADGTKDTTFGTDGVLTLDLSTGVVNPVSTRFSTDSAWGLAKYADDRLVVECGKVRTGGTDTDFVILRLSANGERDATFGDNGLVAVDTAVTGIDHNDASPRNVTILPGTDGILGAGYQPKPGADTSPVVFKVTDAGVLDATFGDAGVFHTALLDEQTESYSAVVQPDATGTGYKIVTTGYGRQLETETTDLVSLRLTSAGAVDPTYGDDGLVRIDIGGFGDNSRNLLVLPDRRVVLVGGGRLTSANVDGVVTVLLPDGAPDTSFGLDGWRSYELGGPADFFWGLSLSPDHKTLGVVGIQGAGTMPTPASAADNTAVFFLPVPE